MYISTCIVQSTQPHLLYVEQPLQSSVTADPHQDT